jgi:5-methylcytosine-specific restriction endonuclease McrA
MSSDRAGSAGSPSLRPQLQLFFEQSPPASASGEMLRVCCRQCRKYFEHQAWYAKQGMRLFFCSPSCKSAWNQDVGTSRLEVRLTGRPTRRGGNWDDLVERVRNRDGHRCRVCRTPEAGLKRRLDVHHRIPARLFSTMAEANEIGNLIALCPPCHKKMEEAGRKAMPLFGAVAHPGVQGSVPGRASA